MAGEGWEVGGEVAVEVWKMAGKVWELSVEKWEVAGKDWNVAGGGQRWLERCGR